ncbi:MAG: hypothetical protein COA52_00535 [Hyphomicrobiales bacterium]|nr:MAG: hypothetical protein COA52_00535 [Hyphomicrobiales bacterium]
MNKLTIEGGDYSELEYYIDDISIFPSEILSLDILIDGKISNFRTCVARQITVDYDMYGQSHEINKDCLYIVYQIDDEDITINLVDDKNFLNKIVKVIRK